MACRNPLSLMLESEQGDVMGIRHKEHPVYGVQFHPESILTPEGHILIESFIQLC